jgi:predicted dithiol-disulfide oxidoreductase (DUF899 family)
MTSIETDIAHPPIASSDEWLVARKTLLGHEKDQLRHYDRVNAERRRLPMGTTSSTRRPTGGSKL